MLLSHRHRFIFMKTSKTAGTSVEVFFERFCLPQGEWKPSELRAETITDAGIVGFRGSPIPPGTRFHRHMAARRVRALVGKSIWNSYFKFCTVRNPYDRALSQYYFHRSMHRRNRAFEGLAVERAAFLDWLKTARLDADRRQYLVRGEFALDDTIRYEDLEGGITRICGILGVSAPIESLATYKSGIRAPEATIATMYTNESRALIEDRCGVELELFGYSFPT